MEITAVVVARKGSVRIKSKSLLPLDGQSLIERKIHQLRASRQIHRVVFGSDCEQMRSIAHRAGAEVVERASYFCDEARASANEMIGEMMSLIRTDVIVWAHCTNPLISAHTYDRAIATFLDNRKEFDSLLSVVELREHLWQSDKRTPLNYNPYAPRHTPARALPPLYMQDGGIFIQPYAQMRANSYFFGKKPYLFEIPTEEFLDINEMRDYLLAKAIVESNPPHRIIESTHLDSISQGGYEREAEREAIHSPRAIGQEHSSCNEMIESNPPHRIIESTHLDSRFGGGANNRVYIRCLREKNPRDLYPHGYVATEAA